MTGFHCDNMPLVGMLFDKLFVWTLHCTNGLFVYSTSRCMILYSCMRDCIFQDLYFVGYESSKFK